MRIINGIGVVVLASVVQPAVAVAQEKGAIPLKPKEVAGQTLDQWVKEILDRDPGVRERALQTVVLFGPEARRHAAHAILQEMSDRDPSLRANAAVAIGAIGADDDDARAALERLKELLSDSQAIVRMRAALALGGFGPPARLAIPKMALAIRDPYNSSWEVRKALAYALGTTGVDRQEGPHPTSVRALADILCSPAMLRDPCALVRLEAVRSLVLLGRPASPADYRYALTAILRAFDDRDPSVALWARVAVMRIQDKVSEKYLSGISKFLTDRDPQVRIQALQALAMIGGEAADHVPEMVARLKDPEPMVVGWAIESLGRMGPAARDAVPSLRKLSDETKSGFFKQYALAAVDAITKPKDSPKLPKAAK